MRRCPITYEICNDHYSLNGLKLLSPKLNRLNDFPYRKEKQLELAFEYSDKLSFSGVQPKLNAKLRIDTATFEIVRKGGTFILKLPHVTFEELPQNEDATMKMAAFAKIETPFHGMIYAADHSLVYFVQRFDRKGRKKFAVEDFGQLAGLPKEAKYDFSMEKLIPIIDDFCTFPAKDKEKLFRLTLFNFLVGNEDMHVKNFSIIRKDEIAQLTPAYDLINSTIVMKSKEEVALPLNGKKAKLKKDDFLDYFGKERLGLPSSLITSILSEFQNCIPIWKEYIAISFLSEEKKTAYLSVLETRARRLFS